MKLCSEPGCETPVRAKKLCSSHYNIKRSLRMPPCAHPSCGKAAYSKGYCVKHYDLGNSKCSVESCPNPSHAKGVCSKHYDRLLKYGNVDTVNKVVGSSTVHSKLNDSDVIEIRKGLSLGERQIDLARKHGVTQRSISAIKRGHSWAWLESPG